MAETEATNLEMNDALHRKNAAQLFNHVWTLLDKQERTQQEDDEMVHAAHASRYHWGIVGTPLNFARGEWQISRVYSVLKRLEAALYHAQRTLDICLEHGYGDFDLAFAYEALARANAIAGMQEEARKYYDLGMQAAEQIEKPGDKKLFLDDMSTIAI